MATYFIDEVCFAKKTSPNFPFPARSYLGNRFKQNDSPIGLTFSKASALIINLLGP